MFWVVYFCIYLFGLLYTMLTKDIWDFFAYLNFVNASLLRWITRSNLTQIYIFLETYRNMPLFTNRFLIDMTCQKAGFWFIINLYDTYPVILVFSHYVQFLLAVCLFRCRCDFCHEWTCILFAKKWNKIK